MQNFNHSSEMINLAKKYVWWESEEWAFQHSEIFLGNVMNLADWDDLQLLQKLVPKDLLKKSLKSKSVAGIFNQRSWDFWHVKLGLGRAPELPRRSF